MSWLKAGGRIRRQDEEDGVGLTYIPSSIPREREGAGSPDNTHGQYPWKYVYETNIIGDGETLPYGSLILGQEGFEVEWVLQRRT